MSLGFSLIVFFGCFFLSPLTKGLFNLALGSRPSFLEQLPKIENGRITDRGIFRQPTPGFEEISSWKNEAKTYEEFLELLFRKAPHLQNQYILVHNSESQQFSSLQRPRVLLFGGGVSIALSDEPTQVKKRIEILETDPKTYEVKLREIVFDRDRIHFVKDPKSCQSCHGVPARPLWNPYDFWPNTYGSSIGRMGTREEAAAFSELLKFQNEVPSLRHLNLSIFLDSKNENVEAFTQFIHQINGGRWISQVLLKSQQFKAVSDLIIANWSFCSVNSFHGAQAAQSALNEYLHLEDKDRDFERYDSIVSFVSTERKVFKDYLNSVFEEIFPNPTYIFRMDHSRLAGEIAQTSQFLRILDRFDISPRGVSSSLIGNPVIVSAPSNAYADFLTLLFELSPESFENIKWKEIEAGAGKYSWLGVDCQSLKKLSASKRRLTGETFQGRGPWPGSPSSYPERSVVSRCASCHVPGADGNQDPNLLPPRISFQNSLSLRGQLSSSSLKQKILRRIQAKGTTAQMPPGQPLSDSEIESLREYLENISE